MTFSIAIQESKSPQLLQVILVLQSFVLATAQTLLPFIVISILVFAIQNEKMQIIYILTRNIGHSPVDRTKKKENYID